MPGSSTLRSIIDAPHQAMNPASLQTGPFERLLRDPRNVLVPGALLLLIAAGWTYMLAGIGMPAADTWGPVHVLAMLAMWWMMMIAMMLPSAASVILLAAALNRRASATQQPFGATGAFAAGYLLG